MITLQFSTEKGFASGMVRAFDHGWCSHVDAVLPSGELVGARYEGGVAVRKPGYTKFDRTQIISIPRDQRTEDSFYTFLRNQLGKPYDSEAIAAFIFDRNWRNQDSWFCSELICAALEAAAFFSFRLATTNNRVTPSDLILVLSALTPVDS
jgi:uncharacterized protein YycO